MSKEDLSAGGNLSSSIGCTVLRGGGDAWSVILWAQRSSSESIAERCCMRVAECICRVLAIVASLHT